MFGRFCLKFYADTRIKNAEINQSLVVQRGQILTEEGIAARKGQVLQVSQQARDLGVSNNTSEELKKRIIHTVVDRIVINTIEGWVELFGLISGTWDIPSSENSEDNGNGKTGSKKVRLTFHEGLH